MLGIEMPPDREWLYVFLCVSAFLAGAMNSIAGGGTLLTFPALMAALSPFGESAAALANATSTVALLPGSLAGAIGYRKELAPSRRFVLRMLAPSLLGGLLGAWLVGRDTAAFATLVPWLVLTAALLFVIQAPVSRWIKGHHAASEPSPAFQFGLALIQFAIAIYGGYFGAGIGILMITTLGFMGVGDIHRVNAVKTFLAVMINGASVIVFVLDDKVRWEFAGVMAGSAIIGGYSGARIARRLPPQYIRYAVIVIGFGLALYYFIKRYSYL
jgi:uncharacterized membrane protein YfcA